MALNGKPIRNPDNGRWYVQVPFNGDFPGSIVGEWIEVPGPFESHNCGAVELGVQGGTPLLNRQNGKWYVEIPHTGDFPSSIAGQWVEVPAPFQACPCGPVNCCDQENFSSCDSGTGRGGSPTRNPDDGRWYVQYPYNGDFPGSIVGQWEQVEPPESDSCETITCCENLFSYFSAAA